MATTIVLIAILFAAILSMILVASLRTTQQAPVLLPIERSPRRIRRRDS